MQYNVKWNWILCSLETTLYVIVHMSLLVPSKPP